MEANNDSLGVLLLAVPFLYACLICNFMMFFGNHLAEVVRSKPGRRISGKTPHTPHFGPFWAYSRTLPQGVEL